MKKISLICLLFALTFSAFSQADRYSGFSGVKVGLNLTNLSGTFLSATTKLKMKPGGSIGLFLNQEISKTIGVRVELGFTQQGALVEESILVHNNFNINFFEATPMLTFNLRKKMQNRFMLVVGPTVCLLSDAKFYNVAYNNSVRPVAYGATFGANYLVHSNDNLWFSFDARYNMGFTDIMRENTEGNSLKMSNFYFGFGLGMPINRFHFIK